MNEPSCAVKKRLAKQGIKLSRISKNDFIYIKSLLNPLLTQAGITPGWTSGSSGSFDPDHAYGGGGKIDAGDVDVMIDPTELLLAFPIDVKLYNVQLSNPLGKKALENLESSYSKYQKFQLSASKWALAQYLTNQGLTTTNGTLVTHIVNQNKNYSVDLLLRPRYSWIYHTHDFTLDPDMRGSDLWSEIYPNLAKISSDFIFVDQKSKKEKGNLQFSPDRGLVNRITNVIITTDKNEIAKILIGPDATDRDLSSLTRLKISLEKYPHKWNAIKQFFPERLQ